MNWKAPKKIPGNRTSIKSTCGQFSVVRDDLSKADDKYIAQRMVGQIWMRLGLFSSADDAKDYCEDHR